MTFDENGICIMESIAHPDECKAYIHFLGHEGERHFIGQKDAQTWAEWHEGMTINPTYHQAMAAFYRSAMKRHQDDLDAIDRMVDKIEAHKETLCAEKTS